MRQARGRRSQTPTMQRLLGTDGTSLLLKAVPEGGVEGQAQTGVRIAERGGRPGSNWGCFPHVGRPLSHAGNLPAHEGE